MLLLSRVRAMCVATLLANIVYFQNIRGSCGPDPALSGNVMLHRLLMVLFLASLCSFLVFGTYFVCSYGFGPCCGKGTVQSWGKHIQRWLLCYTPTTNASGRNVLESISVSCRQNVFHLYMHAMTYERISLSLGNVFVFVCMAAVDFHGVFRERSRSTRRRGHSHRTVGHSCWLCFGGSVTSSPHCGWLSIPARRTAQSMGL
jgi:hypothetical protein